MVFTELRPSVTGTRCASLPSGSSLNKRDLGARLADHRPAHVNHVGQPLDRDGAVHAQIRPHARRQCAFQLDVHIHRSVDRRRIDARTRARE